MRLADSVDRLALALRQLSSSGETLSDADRQVLLDAVRSVDRASAALARLADELPQTARHFSQQLPQVVENARQPIADLASSLQSARDGIYAITESLPQASHSARALVDSSLDSALVRISVYTAVLIAVLALALIAVAWFIYRQYLAPIAAKLEPLAVAPGHFAELAKHMKETSDNLLALQAGAGMLNARAADPDMSQRDGEALSGERDRQLPTAEADENAAKAD